MINCAAFTCFNKTCFILLKTKHHVTFGPVLITCLLACLFVCVCLTWLDKFCIFHIKPSEMGRFIFNNKNDKRNNFDTKG